MNLHIKTSWVISTNNNDVIYKLTTNSIGKYQAKLNCEVLWDDLALEVRWAVAGETIVLQLVGKIGMYHTHNI